MYFVINKNMDNKMRCIGFGEKITKDRFVLNIDSEDPIEDYSYIVDMEEDITSIDIYDIANGTDQLIYSTTRYSKVEDCGRYYRLGTGQTSISFGCNRDK